MSDCKASYVAPAWQFSEEALILPLANKSAEELGREFKDADEYLEQLEKAMEEEGDQDGLIGYERNVYTTKNKKQAWKQFQLFQVGLSVLCIFLFSLMICITFTRCMHHA
jgi:hypothetical protein